MTRPFMLIVAGPNGSGKTTLMRYLQDSNIDLGHYINPDDIAAELQGEYTDRVWRAQFIADRRRHDYLQKRESFTFETVMSHPGKVAFMKKAREAGYFVQLFFVGIDDPTINVERVRLRVAQGGHDVPEERILSRWDRAMALLPEAVRSSDIAYLFDNSSVSKPFAGRVWRIEADAIQATDSERETPRWIARCLESL